MDTLEYKMYRREANRCFRLALTVRDQRLSAHWLYMAAEWLNKIPVECSTSERRFDMAVGESQIGQPASAARKQEG